MESKNVTQSPRLNSHPQSIIQENLAIEASAIQTKREQPDNKEVINQDKVQTVVSKMNEFIEPLRTNLKFVFHDELNEYYVTVVNPLTNEVVKEIPPKKMLDMYAEMTELMGIFIDHKI